MEAKQKRGTATIKRVLDGALGCFAENAELRVSISALAKRSGVSVGSIYHHFGDLDGVRAALYQRCMMALLDALVQQVTPTKTPREGVRAMVHSYLRWTCDHAAEARFIHNAARAALTPAHAPRITAAKAQRLAALFVWLQPFVEQGAVLALPPFLYEMILIGPIAETARRWLADPTSVDVAMAMALLPERLWQALAPPTAP